MGRKDMDISTRPTGLHASRNALLERARRWFIILSVWSDLPAFCRGADLSGYSFLRGGGRVWPVRCPFHVQISPIWLDIGVVQREFDKRMRFPY